MKLSDKNRSIISLQKVCAATTEGDGIRIYWAGNQVWFSYSIDDGKKHRAIDLDRINQWIEDRDNLI